MKRLGEWFYQDGCLFNNRTKQLVFLDNQEEKEVDKKYITSKEFLELVEKAPVPNPTKPITHQILALEITDQCNYNCPYCFEGGSCHNRQVLEFKIACAAIDELPSGSELRFFGGEPLLQFPLIVRLVERYPQHRYSLVTNGSLLTSEMATFFAEHQFSVGVSYDGQKWQKKYRHNPSGSAIDDFYHAMELFKESGLKPGISTVVTRESIPDLYDIHLEVFADFQIGGWAYLLAYSQGMTNRDMDALKDQILAIVHDFPAPHLFKINDLKKWAMKVAGEWPIAGYCGAGICYSALTVSGEKRVCPFFLREGSCYGPNLRQVEVNCAKCAIWEYCRGGCYSLNRFGSGNTHLSHPLACKRNRVYFEAGLSTHIKTRRAMVKN